MKVMTIIGTRPEIIRLSRIMNLLDKTIDHIIVHTGQNYDYELNQIFFDDLEIRKPDFFLNAAGSTPSETIGNIIILIDSILTSTKPDAILILGDTNSCLVAITAKKHKIPIFHMEAGNRCFDQRVPEEINRKIVDHISDINLPYSDISREYLLREGIDPNYIIKIGSPMFEVLSYYRSKIEKSKILENLKLEKNEYFLVSLHREENIDSLINFNKLISILNRIGSIYQKPIIFCAHPRTQKKINCEKPYIDKNVQIIKPLGFCDYIKLQLNAITILSDSGTLTEETSILNLSSLNIRESHERPEGMEEGVVMLSGLEENVVLECIKIIIENKNQNQIHKIVNDYNVPCVSKKILNILMSYVGYVNRNIWNKRD